jgi:hypothetical protein
MEDGPEVPLVALRFKDGRAFDPRLDALYGAALKAGLDVRGYDKMYVYVAGFTWAVCAAIKGQRLGCAVTVTLMEEPSAGWAPSAYLTRA